MDVIKEMVPQIPDVESKYRVAATIGLHAFVWLFFLYEALYKTYFFEKIPLIGLFIAHAFIAAPEINPDAARQTIAEETQEGAAAAKPADEAPSVHGKSHAKETIAVVKQIFTCSVLATRSPLLLTWAKELKELKASSSKPAGEKKEESEETSKDSGASEIFDDLVKSLSLFNILGLGLPASQEAAKESWLMLKGLQLDFGPQSKKSGAVKDRIVVNLTRNMPQYLHIVLALMCLRSFLFRSFFACLPWLVGYQFLSLHIPMDMIRNKLPQVPPVDFKIRVVASIVFHALMWLFFLYEIAFKLHFIEYVLLTGLILAHAFVVCPVPN
jgi:hypothetical protein